MSSPVFYDPKSRRWKRLRRAADVCAVLVTGLVLYFVFMAWQSISLPEALLPALPRQYRALKEKERVHPKPRTVARKTRRPATQVPLNSDEGIRAAFYVKWDPTSYSSLRENLREIDLLFPEWLHAITPDGRIQGRNADGRLFDLATNGAPQPVDDKVMRLLHDEQAETEVVPLVNNFDGKSWVDIAAWVNRPAARANFQQQLLAFLATDRYRGLMLDLESISPAAQPGYLALLREIQQALQARKMKLFVAVPADDPGFNYRAVAAHADGVVLMNYDEYYSAGRDGPVAGQEWFTRNLRLALRQIPSSKLICGIANYGYDWSFEDQGTGRKRRSVPKGASSISAQQAWLRARESEADIDFDSDSLNPHFAMADEGVRHEIWFTDAVTALNQMRAAQRLGINTFALWRLGSEDRSLWRIWSLPQDQAAPDKLRDVPSGQDVDVEGTGDIVSITAQPAHGVRNLTVDTATGLITNQEFERLPTPYELTEYGAQRKQIALTFDDGPNPNWTPKILDVLKAKHVPAAFFLIGTEAENHPLLVQRIVEEGHEIGNHTWTHPDISAVRRSYLQMELNLTERFFAAVIGRKPLMFRPPYSIDQEPDTADQVRPLEITQGLHYITVGDKIDPNDWREGSTPEQIAGSVLNGPLPPCSPEDERCGNIVLLHDGGGDRSATLRALPLIIDGLRARGYELVPVAQLVGKTRDDVMPPISAGEVWSARINLMGFRAWGLLRMSIVLVFFVGDVLMSARLVLVGVAAIFDRFRGCRAIAPPEFQPSVAVLVPAYNEEKVIERTVRSVLRSDYPHLRVIVIDDGSTDGTLTVAQEAFRKEIGQGRVRILSQPNAGKANALNHALQEVTEEVYIGIDADTIIHPHAISRLVPNFADGRVAAVAGNAKVGNRVNLWTQWQALEYITSQNFERRALNCLGAVSVVPGAIGAWRTALVRSVGGYDQDTVAEDGDLTMKLLRLGYRVQNEDRAVAYTEAPTTVRALMRQRFRWSFGILQSAWKHRSTVGRRSALGWIALPNILVFQILLPLISPFIDLMFLIGVSSYLIDRYYHPETADPANLKTLIAFFAAFLVIDFVASAVAFALERRGLDRRENLFMLGHVWLQRFAYRQVFSWVILKTVKRALDGRPFAWDKLERTATVQVADVEGLVSK